MRFGKSEWSTWQRGCEKEWLLTNGIGGFASSTITGGNTRRYHGLLIASLDPPVQRHLILSQLHETIVSEGKTYNLHSFSTGDFIMEGFRHLESFELDPLPVFNYVIGDIAVQKTVTFIYGKNTIAVVYYVRSGSAPLEMRITPLVNFRDYHGDSKKEYLKFSQWPGKFDTRVRPHGTDLTITLSLRGSAYTPYEGCWFENMHYMIERERGLNDREDHYIPGSFDIRLGQRESKSFTFVCSVEKGADDCDLYIPECRRAREEGQLTLGSRFAKDELVPNGRRLLKSEHFREDGQMPEDGRLLVEKEKERIAAVIEKAGYKDSFADMLVRAADHFIAYRRSTGAKTILAGYPWFSDWGRDAMISLCGLTLCTRRFEDAAQILYTFSRYVKHGLIPNMFPDSGEEPGYNTVDAALWYFEAISKYVQYTKDYKFVLDKLYPSMKQIIEYYSTGTPNNIHMDSDGLIIAGDENTQLTWMDAKAGDAVITPRHGKAVEINALWYNSLKVFENLTEKLGFDAGEYGELAGLVKKSFKEVFWNEDGKCLYDVVNNGIADESVRPNQIFAISLTYPVIEGREAELVVEKVWKELYTAYGLRSLSPSSPMYKGRYAGGVYERDSAYHQGTVWAWLIGHFVTAFARTFGRREEYKKITASFIDPFRDHMMNACLGNISEIFDADEPLTPRGCFAQAWSVAEVLRAYVENVINPVA